MALEFNITSPSAASVALVAALVQDDWRDALLDHASGAWTLEEEMTIGGIHWVIVKNDGTISGVGVDFYVIIGRDATGNLSCMVSEVYTAAANVVDKFATRTGSGTIALDADGLYTAAPYTLSTVIPTSTGEPRASGNIPPGASTLKVATHVTEKYAILSHYLASGTAMSCCLMVGSFGETLIQAPSVDEPIIGVLETTYTSIMGSLTRHPVEGAISTIKYAQGILSPSDFILVAENLSAVLTGNYYGADRYQGDQVAACDVLILMGSAFQTGSGSSASVAGVKRGRFSGIKHAAAPVAIVPGDTIVIDDKQYLLIQTLARAMASSPTSGPVIALLMDTGVAA